MARGNKKNGFAPINDLADTNFDDVSEEVKEVEPKVSKNTNSQSNNTNVLQKLKSSEKEKKISTLIYLDPDVSKHCDKYGRDLGKKNGGKSAFINQLLKDALKSQGLWKNNIK
ncbi:hypothetical protein HB837_15715 [Listeria innocua]|uniref:hypothetical protein n=1 Tax=Listeria innocua TaxID=1642 RepID=UPI0016291C07|nr:hypothetical protein [Listeria innocua]MBC1353855.1 hypothetical protein [Listeria innocua]